MAESLIFKLSLYSLAAVSRSPDSRARVPASRRAWACWAWGSNEEDVSDIEVA